MKSTIPLPDSSPENARCAGAFTRVDFACLLAALTLLAALSGRAIAHTKPRADLTVCANNLRQLTRAEVVWASDHNDRFPWRVSAAEGGSQGSPIQQLAWYNYALISNELVTPKILACPSDIIKVPATNFGFAPGGFLNPAVRGNACSYFEGLDTFLVWADQDPLGRGALAGDRHLRPDQKCAPCSSGVLCGATIIMGYPPSALAWTNAIHGPMGNIAFVDGHVRLTPSSDLRDALTVGLSDNGALHLFMPDFQ